MTEPAASPAAERVARFREVFERIEREIGLVIVGHRPIVRKVIAALFAGGHVLIEGVPGLGKTLMVKSVSGTLGLSFKRIQFTPDLMPSDIVGVQILSEEGAGRALDFRPGPIFANVVLADEINRATPKTQSAVLEAMEEKQVTTFGETRRLPDPFFVLATQNPIELEGTYPLPEAQLDRFLFKLLMRPPAAAELETILDRTTAEAQAPIATVLGESEAPREIAAMRALVREVVLAPPLRRWIVDFVTALSPSGGGLEPVERFVRFGPGPRGAQAIVLSAKVTALLDGRAHVAHEDVLDAVRPALRHRLILSFQGEAAGIDADRVLDEALRAAPRP
jgi:MoxR-like ATPase